jgi:hypothetical protein
MHDVIKVGGGIHGENEERTPSYITVLVGTVLHALLSAALAWQMFSDHSFPSQSISSGAPLGLGLGLHPCRVRVRVVVRVRVRG